MGAHDKRVDIIEASKHLPDTIELSKQAGYFTILLEDEKLAALETPLEDRGFKVFLPSQISLSTREDIKRKAKNWAILTQNSSDLIDDACRLDYDVIGIEDLKYIGEPEHHIDQTARKICDAIRRSHLVLLCYKKNKLV